MTPPQAKGGFIWFFVSYSGAVQIHFTILEERVEITQGITTVTCAA
jgi:hypothetical protein